MLKNKTAILQPCIPHYREHFFHGLQRELEADIYVYDQKHINENSMAGANVHTLRIRKFVIGPFIIYNILPFLRKEYKNIILMGSIKHVSMWILLILASFLRKKVILWSHGIPIRRYCKYKKKLPFFYRLPFKLASGAWFYTEKEKTLWDCFEPNLKSVALGNTISNVENILSCETEDKDRLKTKYRIATPVNFIFCARFNNPDRRLDILEKFIKQLSPEKYGFIIIGDGNLKPDFSEKHNVYDFGALYDVKIKNELFNIADIYFQPAWLGLSLVEAMAYGKAVITFKRCKEIHQCVEYYYLEDSRSGYIVESIDDIFKLLEEIDIEEWKRLGMIGKKYVSENLLMKQMISRAVKFVNEITLN